ncbi:ChbG/HpnK family deacetylase [Hylemonella gracilis]|uniref:ChbG/HpnK family deacetylase n=1 Tax=Hylemonella gracilis TaxID=80880 RepID=A0A4P6UHU0_9BURK|nr:ChbG/HpnK family deacetylase [Hylemonella gracilis]QBK04878.1 ChbG/HpnK family deacetylase [Hylemonella gracilis]
MTPIAVCADDYAQNAAISTGILELLDQGRLSAVSCFSMAPSWRTSAAPALRERLAAGPEAQPAADLGLHFNLTEGFGGPAQASLNGLILRSLVGGLNRKTLQAVITTALQRQLDAFEQGLGRAPDFIDGHQHVHQFRGVRDVLLEVWARRYPHATGRGDARPRPWIRNTVPADPGWGGKPKVLARLGGQALAAELSRLGLPSNHGFAGVYGFDRPDYDACFAHWLRAAKPGMLIMCHPAREARADGGPDPIAAQRWVEHRYFSSPAYPEALRAAGVQLQRLTALPQ